MQNRAPRVQSPPDNNGGTVRISWVQIDQQTPDVGPMPDHCWASVANAGPTMVWHRARFWRYQGEILTGSVLVREWDRSDCDSFLWSSSAGDDPIQAADLQGLFENRMAEIKRFPAADKNPLITIRWTPATIGRFCCITSPLKGRSRDQAGLYLLGFFPVCVVFNLYFANALYNLWSKLIWLDLTCYIFCFVDSMQYDRHIAIIDYIYPLLLQFLCCFTVSLPLIILGYNIIINVAITMIFCSIWGYRPTLFLPHQ